MSVAGKREGIKHESNGDETTTRSGLFIEAIRIIKEMRAATGGKYPRYAVWENVLGAFSSNKGEDFRLVIEEFVKVNEPEAVGPEIPKGGWPHADCYVGDGWSIAYRTVDAQYWGVPQRRRRIYLVADFAGERAGEILFKQEGLRGHLETCRTERKGTSENAEAGVGISDRETADARTSANSGIAATLYAAYAPNGTGTQVHITEKTLFFEPVNDIDLHILDDQGGKQITVRKDGLSPTLRAETHGNLPCVLCAEERLVNFGVDFYNQKLTGNIFSTLRVKNDSDHTPCVLSVSGFKAGNQWLAELVGDYKESDCAATLGASHDRDIQNLHVATAYGVDCRNFTENEELYPTLQAKSNGGQSLNYSGAVRTKYIVRRLTPTECCRLQGFPDGWGVPNVLTYMGEQECKFWQDVRNTHALINGKKEKAYTKEQILKWRNGLHTDSAEYKMWGNGICLYNALYVMQGIVGV